MKNFREIQILPIENSDISEIALLQLSADIKMDYVLGRVQSPNVVLSDEDRQTFVQTWTGYFNRHARNMNDDPFALALKAVSHNDDKPNRILGCVFAMAASGNYDRHQAAVIEALFVHPDFWRQGIAARLLKEVAGHLKGKGANQLQLWAEFNNPELTCFYQAQGFHRNAAYSKPMMKNRHYSQAVLFDRDI
jgi:GNAT superfamily N-acetyltransferase